MLGQTLRERGRPRRTYFVEPTQTLAPAYESDEVLNPSYDSEEVQIPYQGSESSHLMSQPFPVRSSQSSYEYEDERALYLNSDGSDAYRISPSLISHFGDESVIEGTSQDPAHAFYC